MRAVRLDESSLEEAKASVAQWKAQLAPELEPFDALRSLGDMTSPALHLDDVSGIPFLSGIAGVEHYQHRARLRATSGDLLAAATEPTLGYEAYCRDQLGLGNVETLLAEAPGAPLEVAHACTQGDAFNRLSQFASKNGGLQVHPFMGIEAVWDLAHQLRDATKTNISVLAPPPPITWLANDKASFEDLVRDVVGPEWLVESERSNCPETLASQLTSLSTRHERVALKRLRCASAMGNQVISRLQLEQQPALEIVRSFLERTEWDGTEEVLALAWENAAHSPSTQLLLSGRAGVSPLLDGIYDQILEGPEQVFVGSRPSLLPQPIKDRLADAGLKVAAALQELGYVGRCSFDFLVIGEGDQARVVFTECNGRWGGTSTPMHLVDRVVARQENGDRRAYRAQDFVHRELVGARFDEVLRAVGPQLYDPATGKGTFMFYNTGPLKHSGKLDVVAVARTPAQADEALLETLPALLGVV